MVLEGDNMIINDVIHGFRVLNLRHSDEIKADFYELVHEKTGAKTAWIKRDDENKTFAIAFKTTPVDDTGVFHILEHSVLNGSDKYPLREPFVDLLKGSLQTFLNAMTYPDKTVYPVSSRNDKDFINLVRVYLDAVFHPLVLKNPNIFYQEGWHYELNSKDEEPIYKGVVFNEMKGAFSSPDSIKSRLVMEALFPDTCYGKESGGDPEHITDLSYEQFRNAHRKYYNPSNSYIILDGDMDIEIILKIIDEEYLSEFGNDGDKIDIPLQKELKADTITQDYEISEEEDGTNKGHITYGYVIGECDDQEKITAFSLISSVLCGSNESPLKKAILSNGLGEDISFDVQDGLLQPFLVIDVVNTDLNKKDLIDETIRKQLQKAVDEGIDKEELKAALNQREFKAKERDFGGTPKGLVFALSSLDTWLYDRDPLDGICFGELFDKLREKISTSYYEDLISDYILNSKHCAKIILNPSNTLGKEKAEKEKQKLRKIAENWNEEDKDELLKLNEVLQTWQGSEDTPEQKATLPSLHLDDLKKTPTIFPLEVCKHNGTNIVLKHSENTNGISYVSIYAECNDFELKEYTILTQVMTMLGKLPTANNDVVSLTRKMKSILGDFSGSFSPLRTYHENKVRSMVTVNWSSLTRNDMEAIELIKEIIYTTDFSDKQMIHDILKQNLFILEQTFINAGHSLALQRALARSSEAAVIAEYGSGYEAYRFLKDLDDHYEEKAQDYIEDLMRIYKRIFIKDRYTISVAGEDKENIVKALLDDAPNGTVNKDSEIRPLDLKREGICVPANVSFASKGLYIPDVNDIGIMYVIANILTFDYLWNNIRVKGGAYGCGFRMGYSKSAAFYSYRDPDPANALKVYKETLDYLKDFTAKTESIENYIVGTTGDYDPLLSTKAGISMANSEYMMEINPDDKKLILSQILSADIEKIREMIPLFEKINEADNVCVVGNKQAIEKCKDSLDLIFDLNSK